MKIKNYKKYIVKTEKTEYLQKDNIIIDIRTIDDKLVFFESYLKNNTHYRIKNNPVKIRAEKDRLDFVKWVYDDRVVEVEFGYNGNIELASIKNKENEREVHIFNKNKNYTIINIFRDCYHNVITLTKNNYSNKCFITAEYDLKYAISTNITRAQYYLLLFQANEMLENNLPFSDINLTNIQI